MVRTHRRLNRRILSVALTAAMIFTLLPTTVFAAKGGNDSEDVVTIKSFHKLEAPFVRTGTRANTYKLQANLDQSETVETQSEGTLKADAASPSDSG